MKALSNLMPGKKTAHVARRAGMALPALAGRYADVAGLHADCFSHGAGLNASVNALGAGVGGARVM